MKRVILGLALAAASTAAPCIADEDVKVPGLIGASIVYDVTDIYRPKNPPMVIPKTWRLVSIDGPNLWFQDAGGAVYFVQGVMQGGTFYTTGAVQRINSK
jgi:hypothetical protein